MTTDSAIAAVEGPERAYSRFLSDSITSIMDDAARNGGAIDIESETAAIIDIAFTRLRHHLRSLTQGLERGRRRSARPREAYGESRENWP